MVPPMVRIHDVLRCEQEGQPTNAHLRKEPEKAWAMVDMAQDIEVRPT